MIKDVDRGGSVGKEHMVTKSAGECWQKWEGYATGGGNGEGCVKVVTELGGVRAVMKKE